MAGTAGSGAQPTGENNSPQPNPETNQPAQPATAPAADESHNNDPWFSVMMANLGVATGKPTEQEPKPDAPKVPENTVGVSFGERAFERDLKQEPKEPKPEGEGQEGKEGDQPPAEPEKPAEQAAEPTAAQPETPKVEVTKRPPLEQTVENAVKKALESQSKAAQPAAPQPEPEKKPEVDPYEQTLGDTDREELEFYRFAAQKDAKHKDLPAKLIGYYKKLDDYITAERAKDPDRTFDQDDEEFRKFVLRNKPALPAPERRKLEYIQIEERVAERIKKENEEKFAKLQEKAHQLEVQPMIRNVVDQFSNGLQSVLEKPAENAGEEASIVAEVVQRAKQEGWEKVRDEDPVIAPVVHELQQSGVQLAAEYVALRNQAKKFDPQNRGHQWLLEFVRNQGNHFAQNGGDARIRDGRQFLPISEYNERITKDPSTQGQYWTFNDRDVLERLAMNTKFNIESRVKLENERLKKAGYMRPAKAKPQNGIPKQETQPAKPAQPTPAAAANPSPKATPVASPGAGKSNPVNTNIIMDEATQRALGIYKG